MSLPLESGNNVVPEATTGGGSVPEEINMDGFFAQQRSEKGGGGDDLDETNGRQRRKRLRRHPVWHFFRDFENKVRNYFITILYFVKNLNRFKNEHMFKDLTNDFFYCFLIFVVF